MAFPYLDNPATLSDTTVQELDGLVTKINTFLSQQHSPQGAHGNVTATSLTTLLAHIRDLYTTNIFERRRRVSIGDWTTVPYAASNFVAVGATWTVEATDVVSHQYALIGQTLHVNVEVTTTDLSAATPELIVVLPAGYRVVKSFASTVIYNEGAGNTAAVVYATPGDNGLHLQKMLAAPWSAGSGLTVFVCVTCEVTG